MSGFSGQFCAEATVDRSAELKQRDKINRMPQSWSAAAIRQHFFTMGVSRRLTCQTQAATYGPCFRFAITTRLDAFPM